METKINLHAYYIIQVHVLDTVAISDMMGNWATYTVYGIFMQETMK